MVDQGGSRLPPAGSCTKVARLKRNLFGKIWIQANRESRKEMAVARRKVPRRAKMAWDKRNIARKTRAKVVQEFQRELTFGRRRQQQPDCSNGIRSRDVEEEEHLGKWWNTDKSIG
jgi:hypothetical protein